MTTPSLKALRLYTESYRLGDRGEWRPALELAKQAVQEDPDFASAQIWLAWALRNTSAPTAEVEAASARALQLADRTTEPERYWIIGSYHYVRQEYEKAVAAFEVLAGLYPEHRWAVNNLLPAYRRLGRNEDAAALAVRSAALRPTSPSSNYGAAVDLAKIRKFEAARPYFARVIELTGGPDVDPAHAWIGAYARLSPAYEAWFKGDARATLAVLDRLVRNEAGIPQSLRDDFRRQVVPFYLAVGGAEAARSVSALIQEDEQRHLHLALTAFAAEDMTVLRDEMLKARVTLRQPDRGMVTTGTGSSTTFLLAVWLKIQAGVLDEGRHLIEEGRKYYGDLGTGALSGELALARGDIERAIGLLRREVDNPSLVFTGSSPFYRGAEALAAAYLRRGEEGLAANVLRAALARRRATNAGGLMNDYYWMRLQLRLAELDHRLGREAEAHALEEELAALLAAADPDFPLSVRLRRLRQSSGATGGASALALGEGLTPLASR